VGISAIAIPIVIWWGMPDLKIYGGLSGLDCALYSLLMVLFINREIQSRSWIWVALFSLLLGGLVAKIIYETATGLTIFVGNTNTNMVPVPLAHLVGGCVGFFVGIRVPVDSCEKDSKRDFKRETARCSCTGSELRQAWSG